MLLPGFSFLWHTHSFMALWTFRPADGVGRPIADLLLIKPAVSPKLAPETAPTTARLRAAEAAPRVIQCIHRGPLAVRGTGHPAECGHALGWYGFTHENARACACFPYWAPMVPNRRTLAHIGAGLLRQPHWV